MKSIYAIQALIYIGCLMAGCLIDRGVRGMIEPPPPPSPDIQVLIDSMLDGTGWQVDNYYESGSSKTAMSHAKAGLYIQEDGAVVLGKERRLVDVSKDDKRAIVEAFKIARPRIKEASFRKALQELGK